MLIGYRYPWLIVVFCIHTYTTHTDWQLPPHFLHYIICPLLIVVYYIAIPPIDFIYIISRRLLCMYMQFVAVHHMIRLMRFQLFLQYTFVDWVSIPVVDCCIRPHTAHTHVNYGTDDAVDCFVYQSPIPMVVVHPTCTIM